MRYGRCLVLVSTLLFGLLAGEESRASGFPGGPVVIAANAVEIIIPDLRYEWSRNDHGLALTWPVGYSFWSREPSTSRFGFRLEGFVEPQYILRNTSWRGSAWSRFHLWSDRGFGLFGDGGYVVGQDGHGAGVGLGIGLGQFDLWMIGISSRYTHVAGEPRIDLAIDVRWWIGDLLP